MSSRSIGRSALMLAVAMVLTAGLALAEGRVIGQVTDVDGNRLPNIQVKLVPKDTSRVTLVVQTNKKGKYAFGLVRAGDYRLIAPNAGMRIARIEANIAIPDDDSLWSVVEDVLPGSELPRFNVTGVSKVTYDLVFAPYDKSPGDYGTGLPVSPIKAILEAIQNDRLDEAIADVEKSLAREPESASLNYLAAFANRLAGSKQRALEAIDTCLRIDPGFEGGALLKGKILSEMGRQDEALALYRNEAASAKADAVRRDAYLEQAILLQDMGNDAEAITALEQLIELAPDLTAAYGDLAALYLKTGQPDKAKVVTDRVIEIGGSNPDLLYNLGVERFNNNDFEAAAGYFDKVVEVAPDHPEAHLQLGYTKLNLGDQDSAVSHLKRFLEVASDDHPGRSTAQAIVQSLTGS